MTFTHRHDITLRQLLTRMRSRDLIDDSRVQRIQQYVATERAGRDEPWFVKLLLAAGAWVAALSFLGFLFIADLIQEQPGSFFFWGAVFLLAATAIRNFTKSVFPGQLALAFSVVGHVLVFAGAADLVDDVAGIAVAALLLCSLLYPLYRDSLHRFLSCVTAASCVTAWIIDAKLWPLLHLMLLLKMVAVGVVIIHRPRWYVMRPLAYAMAASVIAEMFLVLLPENVFSAQWWPANMLLVASLIWLYQWIAGDWRHLAREPMLVAVAATVLLGAVTTPGVLAAGGLMLLGHARRDRFLLTVGLAFFPAFLVVFYYEMELTLLRKSYVLMASGIVLLIARWLVSYRGWIAGEVVGGDPK